MKNSFLTLTAVLLGTLGFSQESKTSENALVAFDRYYNAAKYDSVFLMFSPEAQRNLPLEKTNDFLTKLKVGYGNILSRTFMENQAPFSLYKTVFDKGVLTLSMAVDNNGSITAMYAKPYVVDTSPKIEQNLTKLRLPFNGEWTIFWGGDTKELNGHHTGVKFQKNAFDIVKTDGQEKHFKSTGRKNEDYYAFGQEILAPCDAQVVQAVDGIKDNIPGTLNPMLALGNSVILKTKNNEYILLAHFKQYSLAVKQGDIVKKGQKIGLCGNSGSSSEPHLHFHLQNIEHTATSTGVKCYFEKLLVNGKERENHSPIKGERVKHRLSR